MVTAREIGQTLTESSPDAILLVDFEGIITFTNDCVSDLFGYDPEELIGESVETLVPEGLRQDHVDKRNRYLSDPEPRPMGIDLDLSAQRNDGSMVPVDIRLTPVSIDGDDAILTIVRDISEQEALRTKYSEILETAPDAVFVADADSGELIEVNNRAVELMGYTQDELLGMQQADLHPGGEADRYRTLFDQHVETRDIRSHLPDGSPIYIETRTGEYIPVEINARSFSIGDRTLITGAFRDISDRLKRHQELERAETAIKASGDPIYTLDEHGCFTSVNEALTELAGYDEEGLLGEPAGKIMDQEHVERGDALIRSLLRTDQERDTFEMDLVTASGERIPCENQVALLPFDEDFRGTVGVLRDISDRVERERELHRQLDRLDEFAGVVSHDLRNPLNVAQGRLELALGDYNSDHLDAVFRAHDRMEDLIEDLLSMARAGELIDEIESIDLATLVEGCWRTVETNDAFLTVATEAVVHGDESRLRQLLENLFRNAVEHGGEEVSVTVGNLDDGFYVEDDGPGIPEAEQETVFEAGYSTAEQGTGFGLNIVREIAEAHGWSISVTEGADGGARFEVTGVEVE